ncbi:hypothetical protein D6817_05050 [Candidatus Pacearchaeota archaeon]|nr:MAG: hypothetical protein D6817_05050 [Candidatus Pacearchaeota archaeon]
MQRKESFFSRALSILFGAASAEREKNAAPLIVERKWRAPPGILMPVRFEHFVERNNGALVFAHKSTEGGDEYVRSIYHLGGCTLDYSCSRGIREGRSRVELRFVGYEECVERVERMVEEIIEREYS